MLDLADIVHESIHDILMNQRKRLMVGIKVMSRPSILFLDEPTTGVFCCLPKHLHQLNFHLFCSSVWICGAQKHPYIHFFSLLGLDSLGAHILLNAVARVRDEMKVAMVCTIHQPSKQLFTMFDRYPQHTCPCSDCGAPLFNLFLFILLHRGTKPVGQV